MEKVIFGHGILEYFDNLVYALFKEEYFGFAESAQNYADKIVDYIISGISSFPHKKTPIAIQYLGSNYIFINPIQEQPGIFSLKKETKII